MKLVVASVAVGLLAACTGGVRAAQPAVNGTAAGARPTTGARDAPPASMSSGTAFTNGTLVAWCRGSACQPEQTVPATFIEGSETGVVLFAIGSVPKAARAEVRSLSGEVLRRAELLPGTTMAYQTALGKGRFILELIARWGDREGRWVFGLQGPLGG